MIAVPYCGDSKSIVCDVSGCKGKENILYRKRFTQNFKLV